MTRPFLARLVVSVVAALGLAGSARPQSSAGEAGGEDKTYPAPYDALFESLNPARLQRRFDERRGLDTEQSDKPRAPELPLAVFFESIRPLGSLKYENQLNYFVGSFTGSAPTLQTATYEYVFADWHAARVELIAPGGKAEALGFGYQRTLGVGPAHNWAHGALVLPEVAINGSGFVGGTALYTFAWKPDEDSPWTAGLSVGANRASFANRPLGGAAGRVGSLAFDRMGVGRGDRPEAEEEARVWRTFAAVNVWYGVSKTITLGTEVDAFAHARFGEYLVMPNLTWRPTKHFFVQLGAGWYEIGGRDQATFQCRVNLLNLSPRRSRDRAEGSDPAVR